MRKKHEMVARFPDKETPELKEAHYNVRRSYYTTAEVEVCLKTGDIVNVKIIDWTLRYTTGMKIIIKNCIKRLEKEKDLLAKRRDSIREYLNELNDLDENCSSAIEDIESAVDKLSELV